jgi:hypothetical protein
VLRTKKLGTTADAGIRTAVFHIHVFAGERPFCTLLLGYEKLFVGQTLAQFNRRYVGLGLPGAHETGL